MEFLITLIIGWSITSILVNGTIFDGLRVYLQVKAPSLSKLLTCIQCSGFWVGVFLGILSYTGVVTNPVDSWVLSSHWLSEVFLTCISYGFLNSGVSVILDSLIVYLIKE